MICVRFLFLELIFLDLVCLCVFAGLHDGESSSMAASSVSKSSLSENGTQSHVDGSNHSAIHVAADSSTRSRKFSPEKNDHVKAYLDEISVSLSLAGSKILGEERAGELIEPMKKIILPFVKQDLEKQKKRNTRIVREELGNLEKSPIPFFRPKSHDGRSFVSTHIRHPVLKQTESKKKINTAEKLTESCSSQGSSSQGSSSQGSSSQGSSSESSQSAQFKDLFSNFEKKISSLPKKSLRFLKKAHRNLLSTSSEKFKSGDIFSPENQRSNNLLLKALEDATKADPVSFPTTLHILEGFLSYLTFGSTSVSSQFNPITSWKTNQENVADMLALVRNSEKFKYPFDRRENSDASGIYFPASGIYANMVDFVAWAVGDFDSAIGTRTYYIIMRRNFLNHIQIALVSTPKGENPASECFMWYGHGEIMLGKGMREVTGRESPW